jgi:hypothetical protein
VGSRHHECALSGGQVHFVGARASLACSIPKSQTRLNTSHLLLKQFDDGFT